MTTTQTISISEQLMADFKLGDEKAFQSIHSLLFRSICFFAIKLIKDKQASEDIATESFIKLWHSRANFDNISKIKGFLFQTTKNACIDHVRSRQLHDRIHREIKYATEQIDDDIEHNMIRAELMQLIFQELESLPPACKEICRLLLAEQLTSAEIAEKLKISPQNVDSQVSRAIKRIKTAFIRKKLIPSVEILCTAFLFQFYFL